VPNKKDNVGNYTCGFIRNAVALELRMNGADFADVDFLTSLPNYINNPCITKFMIEQAVLSSMVSNGLAIGESIGRPMILVMFKDEFPRFRTDVADQPVLYCSPKFDFRGIDGIIVSIESLPKPRKGGQTVHVKQGKRKLFMYPIQVTLAPDTHSDSRRKFLDQYKEWTKDLEEFDVVVQFVWITPNPESMLKQHDQLNERYIPLSAVNRDIWKEYQRAKRKKAIQEAPEEPVGREEQRGAGELGESEEFRKCSRCKAEKPLSAFVSLRYVKTCLECQTKKTGKSR
jgi:hypothetical protein